MGRWLRIVSYAVRNVQVIISKGLEGRWVKHSRVPQDMLLLYICRWEDAPVQNDDVDWIMPLNIAPVQNDDVDWIMSLNIAPVQNDDVDWIMSLNIKPQLAISH